LPVNLDSSLSAPESSEAAPLASATEKVDLFERQPNPPPAPARPAPEVFEAREPRAQKRDHHEPVFGGMLSMLETAAVKRHRARWFATAAIAASVGAGMVLWTSIHVARFGRDLLNRGAAIVASAPAVSIPAGIRQPSTPAGTRQPSTPVGIRQPSTPVGLHQPSTTAISSGPQESSAFHHPLEWATSAAMQRATTHLAENFETGMAAWGRKSNDWAPGWSRSRDGYVRPGQLALFQPTLVYADYRVDFFGQIENKSLSWVVRGKDARNYYAMELKLTRAGLRPVLAMVHYPVIDGVRGHTVEVPLSAMVHNDAPYHISVEVKGSHYTAFLEGEEIDSWSDDALLAGGVGFFSEAGARARIYWMRVSRNDDWFGWLCGQIAATAGAHDIAHVGSSVNLMPPPEGPRLAQAKNVEIGMISN
jgi:hypothetical protein